MLKEIKRDIKRAIVNLNSIRADPKTLVSIDTVASMLEGVLRKLEREVIEYDEEADELLLESI
jgi:hypothetical protein